MPVAAFKSRYKKLFYILVLFVRMSERNETALILPVSVHNNVLFKLMCVFVTMLENTEAFEQ